MFEDALRRANLGTLMSEILAPGRSGHQRARYAIFPPLDKDARYPAGASIKWGLILYGDGCQYWQHIICALIQPDALRLGYQRLPVHVSQVDVLHPQHVPDMIYNIENGYLEDLIGVVQIRVTRGAPILRLSDTVAPLPGAAGIEGSSAESGRRTFAARLHNKGYDLKIIKTALGLKTLRPARNIVDADPERLGKIAAGVF